MAIRVEKRDGTRERRILTGMIVNRTVLSRIAAKWIKKDPPFRSVWSNVIGQWCVDYVNRYDEPPGKEVETLFEAWSEKAGDEETIKLVDKFLLSVSDEYERGEDINPEQVLDLAGEYFNLVRVERAEDKIRQFRETGYLSKAIEVISSFGKLEMGHGAVIDVLQDKEALRGAFEEAVDSIVEYSGDLGEFFGDALARDSFIAFMGPEKRGKTFRLMDLGWRGMQQRKRVAYFQCGDMSKNQILRRLVTRALRRPIKATKPEKPVLYPKSIMLHNGEDLATVEFDRWDFDKAISWKEGLDAFQKVMADEVRSRQSYMKLFVHPTRSISAMQIRTMVLDLIRDGWPPDIVLIDYADILAPLPGYTESRFQIDATWGTLRGLSQEAHCLVATATQSDADSYNVHTMTMDNFSDAKQKLAHVTAMYGINQTPAEKEIQVQRLNNIVLREDDFLVTDCIHIAGCMAIGNPAIRSIRDPKRIPENLRR